MPVALGSIREIERELGQLRDASTGPDAAPLLRTSVMTHIAWVPERWAEQAKGTLSGLAERHPSRTILLFPCPDASEDELQGEVDFRCFVRGGHEKEVCSEVISIRLCGKRAAAPASVVTPLLVSDLPAFLRWRGPLPFDSGELDQMLGVVDRLVVDAREWTDVRADFGRLPALFDRVAVSDIAWARTLAVARRRRGPLAGRRRGRGDPRGGARAGGAPPPGLALRAARPRRAARARARR